MFSKNDLKNGDVVVIKGGSYFMFFDSDGGYFSGIWEEEWMCFSSFNDDLTVDGARYCDIEKVYRKLVMRAFPRSVSYINNNYRIVFDRNTKEFTLEEAKKRLEEIEGCKVKINV